MTDQVTLPDETARINEVADELNREAEDVLEYQVIGVRLGELYRVPEG
jgi:hypothetical protein